ncbi:alpha amylase N-terminal ig-like domain-containing protein [Paenibacillus tianjinensis]|uniref:alpha amylase N-terminal ig-like domain-containing protein n=1 Tax=Paenibacillus tianjinensis TaxID=2810347 RepID=UPI002FCAB071
MISNEQAMNATGLQTNISLESLHHAPHSNWAYQYNKDSFHLRVRTKKQNVDKVFVLTGDKYDWEAYHSEHEASTR